MSEFLYLCPGCGTTDVTYSLLAGGEAHCHICPWKGKANELIGKPVASAALGVALFDALVTEVKSFIGPNATDLVRIAANLKIVGSPPDREEALILLNALARSVTNGYLDAAKELEKARYERQKKLLSKLD